MGNDKAAWLKIGGLALLLGVVTWPLAPYLLPVRLPEDFPPLPGLQSMSPGLQDLLQTLDREARQRPGSAEAVGKLGMAYHSNLLYGPAAQAYRIAARIAPGDYQWAYCQAFLQEETGNEAEQLKLLQQTLRLKSDYVPAQIKLADAYFKSDRLDEAAKYYAMAARDGAVLQGNFGLGRVAGRRKEWNKAIEYIAPLSQSYSHVQKPYDVLQEAYTALGQPDKAAEAQRRGAAAAWKIVPPPEDPLNEQLMSLSFSSTRLLKHAGLLSRVGAPDRAIQIARRAMQVAPNDPDVRNYLARTLITFYGDKPDAVNEALAQMGECLRLRPADLTPLWGFASDFFRIPKPPAAVERLRTLLLPHSHLADSHYYLGQAADALGKPEEAIAQYQASLKSNPNDAAVYNKLGQVFSKAGKFDAAVAQFQKSVHLNPIDTGARLNLAIALMDRNNYAQATKELAELLRINPHDPAAHFCMGFAFLYSKNPDEATARFREGLRYKPEDPDAHYGLASSLAVQHKREEALAEVRYALRLRPDFPAAQELLQQLER